MSRSDFFFLVTVASLPIQLNKFFFNEYSYVLGLPIDYRALSIYASDILIVIFLIVFFLENRLRLNSFAISLAIFNIFLFSSSILFSTSRDASFIFNLKILILSIYSLAAAQTFSKKSIQKSFLSVLKLSLFWQGILVLAQFLLQRSLNLQFIGERAFDATTPTIAHSQFFGTQFLRPYGTFPHPNVTAAFLSLSLIILARKNNLYLLLPLLAVAVTFSRAAILVLIGALIASTKKIEYFLLEIFLTAIAAFVLTRQLLESQLSSAAERILLIQAALDIALKNPLFGIGSNNFILELSKFDLTSLAETRLLQPVHNVFLLIATENGIIGLLLFAAVLFVVAGSVNSKTKAILFIALLIYATVDHFLWTLHQGRMLFFLTIAYITSHPQKN
ncbi:MAG: O-antigen ligase family protein [Candidatus Curtissbacteria bacterium]|nr:O-antigen ligase family protein [Candidatus Curtissbacteria bacterium]